MLPKLKTSLIITLKLDETSHKFFDEQRKKYYPAYANFIDAHLTLFHKLPNHNEAVMQSILSLSSVASFTMDVKNIWLKENFIAYEFTSTILQQLHLQMQAALSIWLSYKDTQLLWPHITIQNKATKYKAYKTHGQLLLQFAPFCCTAIGLTIWEYANKKWTKNIDVPFVG